MEDVNEQVIVVLQSWPTPMSTTKPTPMPLACLNLNRWPTMAGHGWATCWTIKLVGPNPWPTMVGQRVGPLACLDQNRWLTMASHGWAMVVHRKASGPTTFSHRSFESYANNCELYSDGCRRTLGQLSRGAIHHLAIVDSRDELKTSHSFKILFQLALSGPLMPNGTRFSEA